MYGHLLKHTMVEMGKLCEHCVIGWFYGKGIIGAATVVLMAQKTFWIVYEPK